MDAVPVPMETLLAHREWVRAVARAVVRDSAAADDVEQETWLAAIRTPPRHAGSLRGWLGAVARSRARRIGRTDTRREAREAAVARDGAVRSPAEIAEIADTHRRVVQAVVELEEPFRAAILLRYFEGLAVEDVAARMAAPLETTRSRLKRGVAKLRERLSRELGTDERPWHLALVPLIGGPRAGAAGGAALGTGGAIVATKATWAVVGVLVVAGAAGVIAMRSGGDAKAPPAPEVASAPAAAPPAKPKPQAPVVVPRTRAAAPEQPAPAQAAPEAPRAEGETAAQRLGRVKLTAAWDRTPLYQVFTDLKEKTGVAIVVSAEAADVLTRNPENAEVEKLQLDEAVPARQILDLVTMLKGFAYVIEEPRVVIVPMGVTRDPSKPVIDPSTVPAPPKLTVVGRVVDEHGVAVPGAAIVRYPGSDAPVATADVAGRFELKLGKPYGSLEARAPGQVPSLTVSVTGEPGAQVTLELATRGAGGSVTVRVVADADEKPIASAAVNVGARQPVPTKLPDGRAAIDRERLGWTDEHGVLVLDGMMPGRVSVTARLKGYADASAETDVVAGKSAEVTLRLAVKPPLAERLKSKKISMTLRSTSLSDAVHYINTVTQLNVVVAPALAAKYPWDTPISLTVEQVTVADALTALCRELGGAEYVLDEKSDVILIRPAAK